MYTTEFRFISEDNMIAFENAPFTYAPKYGGYDPTGLSNRTWCVDLHVLVREV